MTGGLCPRGLLCKLAFGPASYVNDRGLTCGFSCAFGASVRAAYFRWDCVWELCPGGFAIGGLVPWRGLCQGLWVDNETRLIPFVKKPCI